MSEHNCRSCAKILELVQYLEKKTNAMGACFVNISDIHSKIRELFVEPKSTTDKPVEDKFDRSKDFIGGIPMVGDKPCKWTQDGFGNMVLKKEVEDKSAESYEKARYLYLHEKGFIALGNGQYGSPSDNHAIYLNKFLAFETLALAEGERRQKQSNRETEIHLRNQIKQLLSDNQKLVNKGRQQAIREVIKIISEYDWIENEVYDRDKMLNELKQSIEKIGGLK